MSEGRFNFGQHIRGRVYRSHYVGPNKWITMKVTNTANGQVVAWDNGYSTEAEAHDACAIAVGAAREAWMRGFGNKKVAR